MSWLTLAAPVISNTADLGIQLNLDGLGQQTQVANAIKILLLLTVLSIAPALLIVLTSFTRIIIVLAVLRHALGMQQTPPNAVLLSVALFLTLFNMQPVLLKINQTAFQPYLSGSMQTDAAFELALIPLREFMIKQTREKDLKLMIELAKAPVPAKVADISTVHLIPAFILSELKTAFEIGFVIFLPFLLIDIVVSSILMSMGMLMVPPMMISLPIKILLFVLIDGWYLLVRSLMGSFV